MNSLFPRDAFVPDDAGVRRHVMAIWTALAERSANRVTPEECEQLFGFYLFGFVEARHEQETPVRRLTAFRALAETVMAPAHIERVLHFVPTEQQAALQAACQSTERKGRADGKAFADSITEAAGAASGINRSQYPSG